MAAAATTIGGRRNRRHCPAETAAWTGGTAAIGRRQGTGACEVAATVWSGAGRPHRDRWRRSGRSWPPRRRGLGRHHRSGVNGVAAGGTAAVTARPGAGGDTGRRCAATTGVKGVGYDRAAGRCGHARAGWCGYAGAGWRGYDRAERCSLSLRRNRGHRRQKRVGHHVCQRRLAGDPQGLDRGRRRNRRRRLGS